MSELDQEKELYARLQVLLGDPKLVIALERFGPEVLRRSSVLEGFESFIKEQNFRGRVCVEIGTLKGLTAMVLARYFSKVVTIDVKPDPQKFEIAKLLGARNVEFVDVRDNREKAAAINALAFDAAYVDGDHARDTETDFALVRRCGRVLLHEYWRSQPAVWALANRLGTRNKGKFALWIA